MSGLPLNFLSGSGTRANVVVPLTWAMFIISVSVCLVIGALLWIAISRRRVRRTVVSEVPVAREGNGLRLIAIGLGISLVPLLGTLVWTMAALARVGPLPDRSAFTIDVTAHQWWWQIDYGDPGAADHFTTANEIHIPVGVPVVVRLHAADVIHSFWVPQLTGKTDVIPGQTNLSWMEADKAGRYLGECSEFCGAQHGHMAIEVIAQPLAAFRAWREVQMRAAPPPATAAQVQGRDLIEFRCARCHTVRGTFAHAHDAPDLTHIMSRQTLGAGVLPNSVGNLAGWIQDPQDAKPGALMPPQHLSAPQLMAVTAYLETLK